MIFWGFALAGINACAYYWLAPTSTNAMVILAAIGSVAYAPTIASAWSMYADAADYSEWKTGHRFTGMVFATIGFLTQVRFSYRFGRFFADYDCVVGIRYQRTQRANAIIGYHISSSFGVGILMFGGAIAIAMCKLNKKLTLQMADELTERRQKYASATS